MLYGPHRKTSAVITYGSRASEILSRLSTPDTENMPLLIEEALDYAKLLRCVAGREENNALIEKADMIKQKAHALARRNNMDPSISKDPGRRIYSQSKDIRGIQA